MSGWPARGRQWKKEKEVSRGGVRERGVKDNMGKEKI